MADNTDFTEMKQSFNPLNDEPVVQNFNRSNNASSSNNAANGDAPIPEVEILDDFPPNVNMGGGNFGGGNQTNNRSNPNSGFQGHKDEAELPDAEKEASAEAMAELTLMGYAKLKSLMGRLVKISDKKLDALETDGKINLSLKVQMHPADPTKVSVKQIISTFNDSVDEGFQVGKDYVKVAKPILKEEFLKSGLTPSPLVILGIVTVKDLGESFFTTMAQRNKILEQLIILNEKNKDNQPKEGEKGNVAETIQPNRPNRSEPEEAKVVVNEDAPIVTFEQFKKTDKPKREKTTKPRKPRVKKIVVTTDKNINS